MNRRYPGAVVVSGDQVREVKNLGWLLRNWRDVDRFEILTKGEFTNRYGLNGAYMIAHLRSGRRYETPWLSLDALRDWLKRPVFDGVPVHYPDSVQRATAPHGRCERAGRCLEHEQNSKVEACR